jgi:hypothetical protein
LYSEKDTRTVCSTKCTQNGDVVIPGGVIVHDQKRHQTYRTTHVCTPRIDLPLDLPSQDAPCRIVRVSLDGTQTKKDHATSLYTIHHSLCCFCRLRFKHCIFKRSPFPTIQKTSNSSPLAWLFALFFCIVTHTTTTTTTRSDGERDNLGSSLYFIGSKTRVYASLHAYSRTRLNRHSHTRTMFVKPL